MTIPSSVPRIARNRKTGTLYVKVDRSHPLLWQVTSEAGSCYLVKSSGVEMLKTIPKPKDEGPIVDVDLPDIGKPAVKMLADGVMMTDRERGIYAAGVHDGRNEHNLGEGTKRLGL